MLEFIDDGHIYQSIVPDGIKLISTTTVVGLLHEKFDKAAKANSSSIRRPSVRYPNKWYGVKPEVILAAWDTENTRATELGSYYHKLREDKLCIEGTVNKPIIRGEKKLAPEQLLYQGIYPEHFVYLKSAELCGQVDYVEVTHDAKVVIKDYKTSKEIRRNGFKNWEGVVTRMLKPISHLEDCELSHYSIQLSLYMYMILRHNPNLQPGDMFIEHVKFEVESMDNYGYPIYRKDDNGHFIVQNIEFIPVPYLKKEISNILTWLKENKKKIYG